MSSEIKSWENYQEGFKELISNRSNKTLPKRLMKNPFRYGNRNLQLAFSL